MTQDRVGPSALYTTGSRDADNLRPFGLGKDYTVALTRIVLLVVLHTIVVLNPISEDKFATGSLSARLAGGGCQVTQVPPEVHGSSPSYASGRLTL